MTNNKYGLGFHTTTGELGLSLDNFQGDNCFQVWDLGRDLSNYLHENLLQFIPPKNWSDLGFIAVAKGPGSFTSTRIGVVTGRVLAQQLNLPVYGISTLASLAWSESKKHPINKHLAIEMKASRGQLFGGIYEYSRDNNRLITHLEDKIFSPNEWENFLDNWYNDYQLIKSPDNLGYTVDSLLELAYFQHQNNNNQNDWQNLKPFYGQNPT